MKGISSWFLSICLVVWLAFAILATTHASPQGSQATQREVAKGVQVKLLENWVISEVKYRNAVEMVARTERGQPAPARILVTTEPRKNHAEALQRLLEIAMEYEARPSYRDIGGWPALERVTEVALQTRGQEAADPPQVSLRLTIAIAGGSQLVRVEGFLAPGADPRYVSEVLAITRSASFAESAKPGQAKEEIQMLFEKTPPAAAGMPDIAGRVVEAKVPLRDLLAEESTTGAPVQAQTGVGELEIAASTDGRFVVIAANSGYSYSSDYGATFTFGGGTPATFPRDGDPSLAIGESGDFYYAFIGFPNGTPAANNVSGCSTGVSVSTDNGQTFNFRNHAVLCPQTGAGLCFPDQEHIAADSTNAATGGDQVYSVWRNFVPAGAPATCGQIGTGFVTPSIVCSQDGGNNWTATAAIGTGDFPRVTVGSDGFVYVVYRNGANLLLNKFSSCSAGLTQQTGFPVTITVVSNVSCPVAGLDRCNNGNQLSSHMVAVDGTNASHVYVAYATNTGPGNENVIVRDSTDGGSTWPRQVAVNSAATGQRFMPWVCASKGSAYVSWYDRRAGAAARAASNDLTDYYLNRAFVSAGALVSGTETNLSGNPDPQCASGWPAAPRATADSEACSIQPQLAGRCRNAAGGGSLAPCDFSTPACPLGETCQTGLGIPKYGDYNGNACTPCRMFTAWSSATSPAGLPAGAGLRIFSSTLATNLRSCLRIDLCRFRPWLCRPPIRIDREILVLRCDLRPCRVFDPIPRNCLVKWNCPGCPPGGLCPPFYHMFFDGLDEAWTIHVVDAEGYPVPFKQFKTPTGIVISFRPSKEDYIEGQIGNYALVFEIGEKGKLGMDYRVRTRVRTSDRPYSSSDARPK